MATKRPGFARADTDIALTDMGHSSSNDVEKEAPSPEVTSLNNESPVFDASKEDHFGEADVISDAKDIVTHVIHVDDDPTLSPWTFRAFFLGKYCAPRCLLETFTDVRDEGIGLAIFASVIQEIYYFKPQAIYVSLVFITVIGYALGELLALLPRTNAVLRFINPFPFNSKEHAFILIMASAAATNAVSTEILAAQRLYYNMDPSPGASIFLVISSQLLGFGIAGLLRSILVQPTR